MASLFCSLKLKEVTLLLQLQPSLALTFCVLNFMFSLVATIGNLLAICALWKASSIPDTLKKLFLSLALSDLAVGLFVQPMLDVNITVMLNEASNENYDFGYLCPTVITVFMFSAYFLTGVFPYDFCDRPRQISGGDIAFKIPITCHRHTS